MWPMERLSAILFLLAVASRGEIRVSLGTDKLDGTWIVWNQNRSIQTSVRVPGGIYSDLQTAGILNKNLFYRFNDIEYRWIGKDNWTYQTVFSVSPEVLKKKAINLVFHGVDTVGEIYLNGRWIQTVDNMFVRYVIPVKNFLQEKNNTLQVRLKSPILEAKWQADEQSRRYPIPPICIPAQYNGECHVNFLRKMQASFAWDWGPAFPSVGIWKPVEIEAFDLGVIRDVTCTTEKVNSSLWRIFTKVYEEYAEDFELPIRTGLLTAKNSEATVIANTIIGETYKDDAKPNSYVTNIVFELRDEKSDLWWPNGYGKQTMSDLTVSIKLPNSTEISEKSIRIGLRTIQVVQEETKKDKEGLSFYFKINDIPMFMKGTNWIPGHILPELSYDKKKIREALEAVKDANMNILRVWGGGVYESDYFYEVADDLGILIWQDMMFACSMYPATYRFLENVKQETEQQVRRLQHHSSIAVWAGNNENEAALSGNWYGTSDNFSLYKLEYVKLYVDTVKAVILKNDNSRTYLTSSPSNGLQSEKEGYVAKNPYSALYGDVHYYNYLFDGWNDYLYPDTRFASEYGFQSMPSYKAMKEVTLPEDRKISSPFSQKRQHLLVGYDFMIAGIQSHLPLPRDDGSEEYYKTFIYYSQIYQAMSTKTETEKYRRDRSKLTDSNKGFTMGAMYWQLNDVWQTPSWSSIEFGGRWKMLHYFAKKFFSPVLVSAERTPNGTLNIFVVSDLVENINATLNISIYSWDNFIPKKVQSFKIIVEKLSSTKHKSYNLIELLQQAKCEKQTCFVYLTVEGPNIFSENIVYPSSLTEAKNLKKAKLSTRVFKTSNSREAAIEVITDKIAPFVWLETDEDGHFSDNGFMLLKEQKCLTFRSRMNKTVDVDKVKSTLNVYSIL